MNDCDECKRRETKRVFRKEEQEEEEEMDTMRVCCGKNSTTHSWPTPRRTMMALCVVFLGVILNFVDYAESATPDKVAHRTSDDVFMNPCKARAFLGDIALTDEEIKDTESEIMRKMAKASRKASLMEMQVEDPGIYSSNIPPIYQSVAEYKRQLLEKKSILRKMLKVKRQAIRKQCSQGTRKQCRREKSMLRAERRKARNKWRQIKRKLAILRYQEKKERSKLGKSRTDKPIGGKNAKSVKKVYAKPSGHYQYGTNKNITETEYQKDRRAEYIRKLHKLDLKRSEPKKYRYSRRKRAATAKKHRLWDYGVVPFVIGGNFSGNNKALFKLAMRHWENYTCITFKEKEPEDQNYITFTVEPCGCCSFVGKRGNGAQAISIGKNCDKFGIVVHELGHVIGFWHEHTRLDRDDHVQIIYKNIIPGQEYNFNKLTAADVNSLGETYDFGSIMHYARNTFARNTYLDTILPKRKPGVVVRPEIGQRVRLSPGDIRQANKLYKCPTCGRTLQDSSATFSHTPTMGKPELCQWRISATHGEKIVLNVSMLSIPNSYNCETDYLEVRDGHYVKSPLQGRFCGDNLPDTLTSSGTRMWIEYRTRNGGGKGFTANYEAMCGGEIRKDEGFLTSPNYPDDYRPNKACTWKISVGDEFTVALKFQSFEIEKHDDCVYDYLEVRDGPDESSPLIGNYCGYKIPEDIQSTGKDLYVKFVSDGSVQKAGFYAVFVKEFDECSKFDHGCDHVCVNTLGSYRCSCRIGYELHSDGKRCEDACGGYIDQENGTITSPSYPDLYPPNKNCVWQIVAPDDHKININFTHFDIEGHNQDCEYDSVRVSSGVGNLLKLHGVFCGYTFPAPVTSEGNILRIEFNSDNSVQKTGFTATYMTDKDECSVNNGGCQHVCKNTVGSYQCACHNGFTLHDDLHGCKEGGCQFDIKKHYGMINSPNFPENYPSRKDCVWHFTTVPGHRIRLKFKTFELEPHQECTYDHVIVYDGDDSKDRSLGKFCGALVPDPVISSGNKMFMLFFSDASVERKGFEAEHDTVCGAHLFANGEPQGLVSHARYGDHNYDNRADCEWKIQGKEGHLIQLRFIAFDLEDEAECGYDLVQIFDGLKSTDELIGTYCGSEVPDLIVSSSEYLLVRFKSDDTINWKGFSATYQLATNHPDYTEEKESYDLESFE